jgi:predicted XRE-type DNA-binding protein
VALERELLETIDSIKKELDGRPRVLEIIQRCLNNMDMTQARIAVDVGVTQAMVSRKIKWFREKIRKILEESAMT